MARAICLRSSSTWMLRPTARRPSNGGGGGGDIAICIVTVVVVVVAVAVAAAAVDIIIFNIIIWLVVSTIFYFP